MPGGFVNDDEGPPDAAVRECREEICATVEVTGLIGVYHVAKPGAASLIAIGYRARLAEDEAPEPGVEMLEVGVFALDSLPPLAFSSHGQVVDEYVRSLERPAEPGSPNGGEAARRSRPPSPTPARPQQRRRL